MPSEHIRSGFSVIEVMTVVAIIMLLAAITYPVIGSAKESAAIQSSLVRLKQLHAGAMIYKSDWEEGPVYSGLPPYNYVYSTYFGFGKDFFRSPCGYREIIPNRNGFGYQYTWEPYPQTIEYFQALQERAVLFTDASCNISRAVWLSPAALKRGLGVRLDGSIINRRKRGLSIVLSWWGR